MMERDRTPPAAAGPRERVGVLLGDRLCVHCGFNLHGQTISREPHYGMLAVRCPECSTVASLQEYPTAGPWAHRLGLVLAAAWVVCLLAMGFLTGMTFYASAEGAAGLVTIPAAKQLGLAFDRYVEAHKDQTDNAVIRNSVAMRLNTISGAPEQTFVDMDWLAGEDISVLAARGSRYRPAALVVTVPIAMGTFLWGVIWSVALLHRRLLGQLAATGLIVAVAVALLAVSHWGSPTTWDGFGMWSTVRWSFGTPARSLAARAFGLGPALIATGIAFAAMAAGLASGRRIVRGLIRLTLPPRLRGPLAALWHVDGLPSPATREDAWLRG